MARPTTRSEAARRGALLASLLVHALVLAVLGWRAAPRLAIRCGREERQDVELTLVRPLASEATTRTAAPAQPVSPPPLIFRPKATAPAATPQAHPVQATPEGVAVAAPGAPGTIARPAPPPDAEPGGDFRGFLRAGVGCVHRDGVGLTRAERDACDQKAGAIGQGSGPLPIPADKLAGYARQAESDARRRAWRDGSLPPLITACPASQTGSNLGLGCLPKEASHTVVRF